MFLITLLGKLLAFIFGVVAPIAGVIGVFGMAIMYWNKDKETLNFDGSKIGNIMRFIILVIFAVILLVILFVPLLMDNKFIGPSTPHARKSLINIFCYAVLTLPILALFIPLFSSSSKKKESEQSKESNDQ